MAHNALPPITVFLKCTASTVHAPILQVAFTAPIRIAIQLEQGTIVCVYNSNIFLKTWVICGFFPLELARQLSAQQVVQGSES